MRGELDWIVMKALEKDRTRRYETANGFATDVQRYLADEPVLAARRARATGCGSLRGKHRAAGDDGRGDQFCLLLAGAGRSAPGRRCVERLRCGAAAAAE